jgi:hypothetical protein
MDRVYRKHQTMLALKTVIPQTKAVTLDGERNSILHQSQILHAFYISAVKT